MPGRFSVARVSDIMADVVDQSGTKVGSIAMVNGEEKFYPDDEAIGGLTEHDLLALIEVLRLQIIEREWGS